MKLGILDYSVLNSVSAASHFSPSPAFCTNKWLAVRVKLQRIFCAPGMIYKQEIHLFSPDPWLLPTLIILEKERVV